jgi:hypothetical protein
LVRSRPMRRPLSSHTHGPAMSASWPTASSARC